MLKYLPFVALGVLAIAVALVLRYAIKSARVHTRKVLLGALIVSALGPIYVGLVWASVLPDSYLRLARPWALVVRSAVSCVAGPG